MPEIGPYFILKSLAAVAFTAALFWGFSLLLKKFSLTSGILPGHGKLFRVLYRQPLEGRVCLWLIESCNRYYLMSGPVEDLKVLDRLEEAEIPAEFLKKSDPGNPS